jgi:phenylacetate-CoA ligase
VIESTGPSDAELVGALDATVERARRSTLYHARLAGVRIRSLQDLRRLPFTSRADLQAAGVDGTRAVPLENVCHYGESSGTSGGPANTVWLTRGDLLRSARAIHDAHPDVFASGRIVLNRFPFMAAPAHLVQLIAQEGGGVAIPAGNINWDVPFPKALELVERTGAHVIAGLPLEPIVLGRLAAARGLDPARDLAVDTLFLGGSPLPPALQRRIARRWSARVIELYGSTETMLLGTSCRHATLHLETALAYCEVLDANGAPVGPGGEGRLVVTTLGIEGSPLVRLDTGDVVRLAAAPCACGDPRPGATVLGRAADAIDVGGVRRYPFEVLDAAAGAADALDSEIFFVVVLPDRVVVRIETEMPADGAADAFAASIPGMPVEIEPVRPGMLLDIETLARTPHVYKPVLLSDWRRGRRILSVAEGMIEWPRPTAAEIWRIVRRVLATALRRRRLGRQFRLAGPGAR